MVHDQTIAHQSPWTDPNLLADLLDYLREQGFKVTTDDYAVAQDLVVALIARGENVADLARLKACLEPLLCSNPREQDNFSGYFDRWHARAVSVSGPVPVINVETELERTGNRWEKWRWFLIAAAPVLAMTLVFFFVQWRGGPPIHDSHNTPGKTPETRTEAITHTAQLAVKRPILRTGLLLYLLLAALLAGFGIRMWWYFNARLFLGRRSVSVEPNLISIVLDVKSQMWLDTALLRQTARELRRRYPVLSSELAMAATVEQTVLHQGEFTPVFASRLVSPEYLILIDRKSFRDHNARYLDELIGHLQADHVQLTRYYFDQKPRMLYPVSIHDAPVALRDLHTLYRDARVLIFAECSAFFDEILGEVEGWTESLGLWTDLAVFSPAPKDAWGYYERRLAKDALVLPGNASSVLAFARHVNGMRGQAANIALESAPFPHVLTARSDRWLERDAPPAESVEDLFQSVRRFLGEESFFWLSSCAAYPEIHFNLTSYLGGNLHTPEGKPVFNDERAAALFRLPWMQRAYMPDWVRLHLLTKLSREQLQQVQELFGRLWLSVATDSSKAIKLEIARQHPRTLAAMARGAFAKFRKNAVKDSPLRDYVFATMMLGKSTDPLSVRLPKFWRAVLRKAGDNVAEEQNVAAFEKLLTRFVMAGTVLSALGAVAALSFPESSIYGGVPILLQLVLWLLAMIVGLVSFNRRLLVFFLAILNGLVIDGFAVSALIGTHLSAALISFALELPHIVAPIAILFLVSPRPITRLPLPWDKKSVRRLFWVSSISPPAVMLAGIGAYIAASSVAITQSVDVFAVLVFVALLFINHSVGLLESCFALKIGSRSMYVHGLWTSLGWLGTILICFVVYLIVDAGSRIVDVGSQSAWLGIVLASLTWVTLMVVIPIFFRKSLRKGELAVEFTSQARVGSAIAA